MDHCGRAPAGDGHVQRVDDDLGVQRVGDGPADDPPGPDVQHHREIDEADPCRDVGDVGDPLLVGPDGSEVALEQIRRRASGWVAACRAVPAAPADAFDPGAAHQPSDPVAADPHPAGAQLGMDPWPPVGAARGAVDLDDLVSELTIGHGPCAVRPCQPGVEAAGGDTQQLGHPCHRVPVDDLRARTRPLDAVLDCTGGWYSTQRWDVVAVADLLGDTGDRSFEVRSATGYRRLFPMRDAATTYLAVGYDGRPLRRGHGAPVRLVAPGRRGPWWVKWVVTVEPSARPWWQQLPLPAT